MQIHNEFKRITSHDLELRFENFFKNYTPKILKACGCDLDDSAGKDEEATKTIKCIQNFLKENPCKQVRNLIIYKYS